MKLTIDREALRAKLPDPIAVIREANRLGYSRGQFGNGLEVIAAADGSDYVAGPSFTMRQARDYMKARLLLPVVDMGR